MLPLLLQGCDTGWLPQRRAAAVGLGAEQRLEPALSGDGRLLASILESNGRRNLVLQDQASGRVLPLRHLRGHQPHRWPALSWNGRYVALLMQQGNQQVAVIEDRLRGQLLRVPPPPGSSVEGLSLAPDGQRLALQVLQNGQQRVQLFELGGLLEPDLPGGRRSSDPP